MPSSAQDLRRLILDEACRLGFALVGIAAAAQFPTLENVAAWLDAGRGGEMRYLARRAEGDTGPYLREDPRHLCPWARSVIVCGLVYNTAQPRSIEARQTGRGWISRYAWGDDYHQLLRQRLTVLQEKLLAAADMDPQCRITVDTAPIVERAAAQAAGLGWIGKNTCLIHPRQGSWFFLGTLITSLELAEPAVAPLPDRCGSCTRCLEACPTGALDAPYHMDARRCLAYLNIEQRGPIPAGLRAPMGTNLLGCDICQDVCPWNRKAPMTFAPEFQPREGLAAPLIATVLSWTEQEFRSRLRGSAMKRAKYRGLIRNALIAAGNSGDPSLLAPVEGWLRGNDPLLREHAEWAAARLRAAAPPQPS